MNARTIKSSILFTLSKSGLNELYRHLLKNQTIVLMYHGVAKDKWFVSGRNWLQVKESEFRKQMEHLKTHYDVVPLDYALRTLGHKSRRPKVVITFDDGYANNYTVAYPILKELQIPATIFLVSSMIDTANLFWYDRLRTTLVNALESNKIEEIVESYKVKHPHTIDHLVDEFVRGYTMGSEQQVHDAYGILTYSQIREMQSSGLITFDSHTNRHEIITQLVNDEPYESIGESLEIMRGHGIECGNVFCYPNGRYNERHFETLHRLGFKAATSTICKMWSTEDHFYEIPRIGIGRDLKITEFECFVSGMWKSLAQLVKGVKQTILMRTT